MIGNIDWLAVLTIVIAAYGALLSTILAARELQRDRPNVRVECTAGIMTTPSPYTRTTPMREVLIITAINAGHRPSRITALALVLNNGFELQSLQDITGSVPLPKQIAPSEEVSIRLDLPDLVAQIHEERSKTNNPNLKIVRVVARDSLRKVYRGKLPQILKDRGLT